MRIPLQSEYVDVGEAARLLNVTKRHVARLGDLGAIRYVGHGLVERDSVIEYLQEREFSRTRAWSEETAWGAVALLSGLKVDWLGQVQTSRLRGRLRKLADDERGSHEIVGRARNRAVVRRYESFGFLAPMMRKEIVAVSRRRLGLADARRDHVDGYIEAGVLADLEKRYGLRRSARGTMIIRATTFDIRVVKRIATKGNGALAAMDAAGSTDSREHGVGTRALTAYLEGFARGRTH
ncbi:helix-turn-helix domain-containing protein [Nocardioides speluncae]|uniref:helix-turn-helix domain-containing protein n=1 Tax=Nocardioides speluncae TaxID=2670337 RepID=UPI000D685CEF|nr:helix-turn-helix domain-containing protein [Nocardioides speluncae]